MHHFINGIPGCLSCLVSGLDEEEAYHLVLLAGGDDGEILVLAEHALSGAQRFQLHAAMRAGASANGVRKVVFTPPRMSALGADVRAVRPLDGVMLEAMVESVCPLCGGQFWQSLAQSCDFLLYGCSRFHNQKLNRLGCCTSCAVALVAVLGLLRFCNLRSSSSWYLRTAFCRASAFSSAVSSTTWFTATWHWIGLPTSISFSS